MKERPILFSAPMVRAILEERKTQTRRVVNPQPEPVAFAWRFKGRDIGEKIWPQEVLQFCPYGQVGDRLWVREAFAAFVPLPDVQYYKTGIRKFEPINGGGFSAAREVVYRADGDDVTRPHPLNATSRWKPSIHMPRWASRLTLEITEIRVERLQEITDKEAIAEGVPPEQHARGEDDISIAFVRTHLYGIMGPFGVGWPRTRFAKLWSQINGPDSWDANPWVWVVSFRRVEEGGAA